MLVFWKGWLKELGKSMTDSRTCVCLVLPQSNNYPTSQLDEIFKIEKSSMMNQFEVNNDKFGASPSCLLRSKDTWQGSLDYLENTC